MLLNAREENESKWVLSSVESLTISVMWGATQVGSAAVIKRKHCHHNFGHLYQKKPVNYGETMSWLVNVVAYFTCVTSAAPGMRIAMC